MDATVVTKKVKMPLEVTMTGPKVALDGETGDALIASLVDRLPLVFRLGRGRKETIQISVKVPKATE